MPTAQHIENVVDGRSARRSHNTDTARKCGNRLFARCIEQTLCRQLCLELLECNLERARSLRLEILGNQLQLTTALVNGDASASDDLHAILRTKAQQARLHAEHHYP